MAPAFLTGGGEMALALAARDWSGTSLGAPEAWSPALKVAAGMMLASPIPTFLAWGPETGQNWDLKITADRSRTCSRCRPACPCWSAR